MTPLLKLEYYVSKASCYIIIANNETIHMPQESLLLSSGEQSTRRDWLVYEKKWQNSTDKSYEAGESTAISKAGCFVFRAIYLYVRVLSYYRQLSWMLVTIYNPKPKKNQCFR